MVFSQILNPADYQSERVRKPVNFFGEILDLRHKVSS